MPAVLFPRKFSLGQLCFFAALFALPWACRAFISLTENRYPRIHLLLLILLLTHLPGFYATVDNRLSLEKFLQNLAGIAILSGLLHRSFSVTVLKRLLFLFLCGCSALALLLPLITQWEWSAKLLQIPGLSLLSSFRWKLAEDVNPNIFGGLMTLVLPVALGLRLAGVGDLFPRFRWTPRVLDFSLLVITIMFVLSQARGGILGVGIALLFMAYCWGKKFRWWIAGGLYGVLAAILWLGPGSLKYLLGGSGVVASWDVRVELWSRALYMIQDFPFTGVGIGLYGRVANILYPFFLISPDEVMGHAHQMLLQIAVDLGIPGLVAYSALLGAAFSIVPFSKTVVENSSRRVWLGLVGGLIAMLLHGMLDCPLWSSKLAPVPWIIMAFLFALAGKEGESGLKRWEIFCWWVLISLLAIAQIGDRPLLGLLIAILGGAGLGVLTQRIKA